MSAREEKNISIVEWVESIAFSLGFIVLLFTFVFRIITVSGHSMDTTLADGDRLVVSNLFYAPQRQDIVVIDGYIRYGQPIVKRVIGLPGDEIDIDFKTGDVFVNGQLQNEEYIFAPTTQQYDVSFPLTVPQNTLFVMGDNRPNSLDSRSSEIGFIDVRDVLGHALLRIFPFQQIGGIK